MVNQAAPSPTTTGIASAASNPNQSQRLLAGCISVAVVFPWGVLVTVVLLTPPVNPVQSQPNKCTAIVNAIIARRAITIPTTMNGCCFIFCHHVPNFEAIIVPHFSCEMELHPFRFIVPQEKEQEAMLFVRRVPTLPKSGTGYFAAHNSLRSSRPISRGVAVLPSTPHLKSMLSCVWIAT